MNRRFRTIRALELLLALGACPGLSAAVAGPPAAADAAPSKDGQGLLSLGTSLTDRGDYQSAEIAYRQILDRPGYSLAEQQSALMGLGRTCRKAGEATKAAAIYEKFVKEFPNDERVPDALLELGRTLRAMGANKMALNRFYSVINTTLKLPQKGFEHYQSLARTAEYEIAETYFETGDFALAQKYFSRLQLLDLSTADRARASFMAAHSQILAGDFEAGARSLRAYLETWPDDENVPEARYLLASTLRKLKRPQEALAVVLELLRNEKSVDIAEPQTWAYWQRRTGNLLANDFFQSGDAVSALAIYKSMTNLGTEPEWQLPVLYQVALCHERLYEFKEASDVYNKIVEAGAKPGLAPDIAELAQMATWRLNHIEWLQSTDTKLASFLNASDRPSHAPAKAAAEPAAPAAKQ
ncbi:MAG TPA: tetratricopeptide repeat protein [Opitutaceae bacterium]|nr:tetratricopeptide repeat protein [Opitutaceae bacterium]